RIIVEAATNYENELNIELNSGGIWELDSKVVNNIIAELKRDKLNALDIDEEFEICTNKKSDEHKDLNLYQKKIKEKKVVIPIPLSFL
ncbi:2798_t:CDS:2, partial [Racocetra persica]